MYACTGTVMQKAKVASPGSTELHTVIATCTNNLNLKYLTQQSIQFNVLQWGGVVLVAQHCFSMQRRKTNHDHNYIFDRLVSFQSHIRHLK